MRVFAALLPLLLLSPASTAVASAYEEPTCYDIAVVGTVVHSESIGLVDEWLSAFHWQVRVERVLEGENVPGRIRVTRIAHAEYARYPLKNWVILAAKDHDGYFIRGWPEAVRVDGRGLPLKGVVERIAREAGIGRCMQVEPEFDAKSGGPTANRG